MQLGSDELDDTTTVGPECNTTILQRIVNDAVNNASLNSLYRAVTAWQNDPDEIAEFVRNAVKGRKQTKSASVGDAVFHAVTLIGNDDLLRELTGSIGPLAFATGLLSTQKYTFEIVGERYPRWLNCVQLAAMQGHTAMIEHFDSVLGRKWKARKSTFANAQPMIVKPDETTNVACELTLLMLAAMRGQTVLIERFHDALNAMNDKSTSDRHSLPAS